MRITRTISALYMMLLLDLYSDGQKRRQEKTTPKLGYKRRKFEGYRENEHCCTNYCTNEEASPLYGTNNRRADEDAPSSLTLQVGQRRLGGGRYYRVRSIWQVVIFPWQNMKRRVVFIEIMQKLIYSMYADA